MLLPLLHTVKVKSGESCAKCKYLWKESLNSDGHQFHQYHKKKTKKKRTITLNSDGQ